MTVRDFFLKSEYRGTEYLYDLGRGRRARDQHEPLRLFAPRHRHHPPQVGLQRLPARPAAGRSATTAATAGSAAAVPAVCPRHAGGGGRGRLAASVQGRR